MLDIYLGHQPSALFEDVYLSYIFIKSAIVVVSFAYLTESAYDK